MIEKKPAAVRVGKITAMAHRDAEGVTRFAHRASQKGYAIQRTQHFVVARRGQQRTSGAIVMHTFSEATIDEDLSALVADELGALGLVGSEQEYSEALFAVMASTQPDADQLTTWRRYSLNTLARIRGLMDDASRDQPASSHVAQFAAIYRRVLDLSVGDSLLDVGSSLGFLPILAAERGRAHRAFGCDNRQEVVACATDLARVTHTVRARFERRDVLEPEFRDLGRFSTVTAIHLIEHLSEDQLRAALANMLSAAASRLIIAVPYERRMERLYGHEQLFTPERLRSCGRWCVDELGAGRSWCEDVSGGLLVVDQAPAVRPQAKAG